MQTLLVHALAMRQLGRLNPRHLLAAGYRLRPAEWCPRTIHTRQLWGCLTFPALDGHRPVFHGRDAVRSWSVNHLRYKSKKKGTTPRAAPEEDEDDSEESDYEDVDPNLPKDYKDMEKYVQSFRYDVITKAGLDIARNKIEDAFYSEKLRLNGQKLIKKSKTVKPGDTLDLVLSENKETNTVTLMRVILRRVLGESNDGEKYKVSIRRWKCLELAKDEAFKP
ncbi:mitochondrial transcription rescue factor 1 [Melanotaenia boesemani]|uniref:mitochondrial transcription rescue factor 1 n=1 Tax=Melanotaenia boesemani TaxID=1250792 RepID=UPI001C03D88A|nr:mitochondrial transcription rescue factor 1 [Melanotaenia boesemani]XP_041827259.1 mitochondrial transcription rescue factor 1 [Melanotaenia boesemani]XP_041827260.1 mitochondrial transcription rescue factor 1 [Melanotaenia boesemani]XP_041827261.1 mitochondrial transcription rescue factor 1 [Melanotaenia boesemani]